MVLKEGFAKICECSGGGGGEKEKGLRALQKALREFWEKGWRVGNGVPYGRWRNKDPHTLFCGGRERERVPLGGRASPGGAGVKGEKQKK